MTVHKKQRGKIARWIENLTDEQVVDLLVRIDRQMAYTGMEAGPIRNVLLHFAANVPAGANIPEEAKR